MRHLADQDHIPELQFVKLCIVLAPAELEKLAAVLRSARKRRREAGQHTRPLTLALRALSRTYYTHTCERLTFTADAYVVYRLDCPAPVAMYPDEKGVQGFMENLHESPDAYIVYDLPTGHRNPLVWYRKRE